MNEYIFYTTEGHTDAPNGIYEVENCQMLGIAKGKDKNEALENLLKENSWITKAGFSSTEFMSRQVLTEEQRSDISAIIEYNWADEKKHYEETFGIDIDKLLEETELKGTHIFPCLYRLKKMTTNR